jgi:hypothetical protein
MAVNEEEPPHLAFRVILRVVLEEPGGVDGGSTKEGGRSLCPVSSETDSTSSTVSRERVLSS